MLTAKTAPKSTPNSAIAGLEADLKKLKADHAGKENDRSRTSSRAVGAFPTTTIPPSMSDEAILIDI